MDNVSFSIRDSLHPDELGWVAPFFLGKQQQKNHPLGFRREPPPSGVPSRMRALSEGSRRFVEVIFFHHGSPEVGFLGLLTILCVLVLEPLLPHFKVSMTVTPSPTTWPHFHVPFPGYGIPWPLLPSPQTPPILSSGLSLLTVANVSALKPCNVRHFP